MALHGAKTVRDSERWVMFDSVGALDRKQTVRAAYVSTESSIQIHPHKSDRGSEIQKQRGGRILPAFLIIAGT